ncbi:MAG: ATP-dependent DNA helicase RecG [Anaerolineae bacterium]
MPSALEKLVKVLKLEQEQNGQNRAVIGGLGSFAERWQSEARSQAKKPEHHLLIDELVGLMQAYEGLPSSAERLDSVRFMLDRIMGRIASRTGVDTPAAPDRTAPKPPEPELPISPRRLRRPAQAHMDEAMPAPREYAPLDLDSPSSRERAQSYSVSVLITSAVGQAGSSAPQFRPPRRRRPPLDVARDMAKWRALQQPVTDIGGVGPKNAEKLEAVGIKTLERWLFTFPRRYDDYSTMLPLNKVRPGMKLTVAGVVREMVIFKGRKGTDILNVTIHDGTGSITASFFNQVYLRSRFERGMQIVLSGKVDSYQGRNTMYSPSWEMIDQEALNTRAIVPIYPLTKGLSAHQMRKMSAKMLERVGDLPDYMPSSVLERVDLADLSWALQQAHFPDSQDALRHAKRRLAFDSLIMLQLAVLRKRREWQSQASDPCVVSDAWLDAMYAKLPFTLTNAQKRAISEIRADMMKMIPMNRLLQGDVGAGKTVVAALMLAIAVANGAQAALMAPTSILAEQHYKNLTRLLGELPEIPLVNIQLLTGATPARERADILSGLAGGTVNIILGTHALLESGVQFNRLGAVVIDEQHRFGVEQRGALRGKGTSPHVLVMTATPIPRTLALTMFADLDLSVLDELPPGRTPITTRIVQRGERERIYGFIESHIQKGRQAYIVCPLVEVDDETENPADVEMRAAVDEYERLQREVYPNLRLGLMHGKLTPNQKEAVMRAFSAGNLDILVTTSVIEVGVDVPNANVILIEGANRFGLAQLHQFRGRVGRGEHPSYCLLLPDDDNTENERLRALESTTDGFKLAEMDWQFRGAGDLLGTRQSGGAATLGEFIDPKLVAEAQVEARTLYEEDAQLALPEHALLKARLEALFGEQGETDIS